MNRTLKFSLAQLIFIIALAVFFALTSAHAHAQVVGGTLSGTVTDSTGAALTNAVILVHNDETGNERNLTTGPDGRYSAPSIPIGTYTITAKLPGFTPQRRTGIPLTVGQSKQIDLTLTVDAVTQQISVEDTPSVVNTSTQQTSGLVDERQIKQLPLNGRSYDQLITLNPGVVNYTGQRSGSIGTSNSSVGNMFAISGRRPQDNLFLLNGIEYTGASLINVTPGGTSGQLLGVDAVREFNVVSDSYSASYGKRQGAQISIVTASGTNKIHGSAYEFIRNSALDARNYFDQSHIPEFQRNNFGASLGGPIRKDKLLLFANYEGYRQNLGLSDVTFVPNTQARLGYLPDPANPSGPLKNYGVAAGVAPLLNLWPAQNGPELRDAKGNLTGIALAYSNPIQHIREDFGTTRFDYNISPNDLFFAAYTVDDSTANTPTQNPLSVINETLREQVLSLQEQHVFSPHLLNTARVGFSRASFYFLGSTPINAPGWVAGKPIGAIVIAGSTASNGSSQITGAGANVGSNNATTRNLFTFDDHIFWSHGRHQIEAGGWIQRLQSNDNLAQFQYGQASFASLTTFLQGTVKTFSVVPAPTELGWRSFMGAGYLEDTIRITPRLELRAGLRFESTNGFNESQGRASIYGFTNGRHQHQPHRRHRRPHHQPRQVPPRAPRRPRLGRTRQRPHLHPRQLRPPPLPARQPRLPPRPGRSLQHHARLQQRRRLFAQHHLLHHRLTRHAHLALQRPARHRHSNRPQLDPQRRTTNRSQHLAHRRLRRLARLPSDPLRRPQRARLHHRQRNHLLSDNRESQPARRQHHLLGLARHQQLQRPPARSPSQLRARLPVPRQLHLLQKSRQRLRLEHQRQRQHPSLRHSPLRPQSRLRRSRHRHPPPRRHQRHLRPAHRSQPPPRRQPQPLPQQRRQRLDPQRHRSPAIRLPLLPAARLQPHRLRRHPQPRPPRHQPNFHGNLYPRTPQQFFNPDAFSAPAYGTVGNLGRDTLTGPNFANLDLSLLKSSQVTEHLHAQFRAEFFNILNRTNFATPNPVVFSSGPTQGTTTNQNTVPVASPTAGVITATANNSRQIQFGLKLLF